jgi:hypothetical protein
MAIEEFKLTPTEKASALWVKLEQHFNGRIDILRKRNDNDAKEEATIALRAQIRELKYVLSLADVRQVASEEFAGE